MKEKILNEINEFVSLCYTAFKLGAGDFAKENFPTIVENFWDGEKTDKENLETIKSYSIGAGLAINLETPIKELIPYLPYLDEVIVMSIIPGSGGQQFHMEAIDKIKELKDLINSYHFTTLINVDGGINDVTKDYCSDADILSAGSYIVLSDNFQERISSLRD